MTRRDACLEAFNTSPTDGSFTPPADRPSIIPNVRMLDEYLRVLFTLLNADCDCRCDSRRPRLQSPFFHYFGEGRYLNVFARDVPAKQLEGSSLDGLLSHLGLAVGEDLDHVLPSEGIEQLLPGALHLLTDVNLCQL
jgi:hypothetical protein